MVVGSLVLGGIAYLLGSIPVAVLVARAKNVDPRSSGDGNPGWWNCRQLLGTRLALVVLVGDVLKGAVAVALAVTVASEWGARDMLVYMALFGAMVGHAFPVFAGFRGGKSILTFCGGAFVLHPVAGLLALAVGALAGLVRSRLDVGLRVAMVCFAPAVLYFAGWRHAVVVFTLMAFIGLRFVMAGNSGRASAEKA